MLSLAREIVQESGWSSRPPDRVFRTPNRVFRTLLETLNPLSCSLRAYRGGVQNTPKPPNPRSPLNLVTRARAWLVRANAVHMVSSLSAYGGIWTWGVHGGYPIWGIGGHTLVPRYIIWRDGASYEGFPTTSVPHMGLPPTHAEHDTGRCTPASPHPNRAPAGESTRHPTSPRQRVGPRRGPGGASTPPERKGEESIVDTIHPSLPSLLSYAVVHTTYCIETHTPPSSHRHSDGTSCNTPCMQYPIWYLHPLHACPPSSSSRYIYHTY